MFGSVVVAGAVARGASDACLAAVVVGGNGSGALSVFVWSPLPSSSSS